MTRCITILAFPFVLVVLAICSLAQETSNRQDAKKSVQKQTQREQDSPIRPFMRGKLELSQNVLEGIVTEDFDQIRRSAEGLRVLSLNTMWHMFDTPEYIEHSGDFQRVVTALADMAEKKNLDGAAVKYVEMTLNCVNCHKYVRTVRTANGVRPAAGETKKQAPLDHDTDVELFHFLVDNRQTIRREVTKLPNGVESVTESDLTHVREKLVRHVDSMYRRMKEGQPIHLRDPLFAELFKHADKITTRIERTDKGVTVRETSDDDYAVKLIQAHAEVVSLFIKHGRQELRKNHDVPARE